ncbi:hypothetical protein ACIO87_29325 [Streptomyces sp. NPDC087218]|uniref:hypothetical protein n=1 Tax=Streptomyces sp. NPDC087218 TaxID=3365769 RepID=UPI00382161D5
MRGSVVEHYNSPAIASTLQKGHDGRPRKHWWITEPVAEAVSVRAQRVFAPICQPHLTVAVHGPQMVKSFITFANAGRTWSGLMEIPPGKARPRMFRRTMAMLTDQFPGSEIALGIQLKHLATRALANRSTRGYAASDPAWADHLQDALDIAKFRRLKDLCGDCTSGADIGFGPGADRIKEAFDQIQATVAARGGDARIEDSLLRKARITIRFGTLNHCLFDGASPVGAVCLENTVLPVGHTGPLDNRRRPDRCHNSMIGPEHLPIYDSHRRTQLKLLDTVCQSSTTRTASSWSALIRPTSASRTSGGRPVSLAPARPCTSRSARRWLPPTLSCSSSLGAATGGFTDLRHSGRIPAWRAIPERVRRTTRSSDWPRLSVRSSRPWCSTRALTVRLGPTLTTSAAWPNDWPGSARCESKQTRHPRRPRPIAGSVRPTSERPRWRR